MDTGFGEEKILNWQGVLKMQKSLKLNNIQQAATNEATFELIFLSDF